MHSISSESRVAFVQFGDFRAADEMLKSGFGETFNAQKYSMDTVERLISIVKEVSVICVKSELPHDIVLPSGIRSIGLMDIWSAGQEALIEVLNRTGPTHIVLRFPSIEALEWARKMNVSVLVALADSFGRRPGMRGLVDRWRAYRFASLLNLPFVTFVGNHNIGASEALARIGVKPEKIVPWDWPRSPGFGAFNVKKAPASGQRKLIFVGSVSEAKGVGDLIRAIAADPKLKSMAKLDVLGSGAISEMQNLANNLGLNGQVRFAGQVPLADVAPAMHAADAVIVYSRHEYSEGLPGTIYLGLISRTPLVISDHPMFKRYFKHDSDLIIVPQKNPRALAAELIRLFEDTELYETLTASSEKVLKKICHPVLWRDVIERGLRLSSDDEDWLKRRTLPNWF